MHFVEAKGVKIPAIGLGTWELRGRACARIVEQALRLGYRHIDTAQMYDNEREVGEGVRASGVPPQRGVRHHEDLDQPFRAERPRTLRQGKPRPSCGLTEVDLLLLHWPNPRVPLDRDARRAGACPQARHGEAHRRVEFQRRADGGGGGAMPGAAGLQPGRVSSLSRPDQGAGSLRAARACASSPTVRSPRAACRSDESWRGSARAHGKSAAQVCLRWLVQQQVSAIPRTSRLERLSENIAVFDFELSAEEMAEISAMGSRDGRLTSFGFAPKWD